MDKALTFFVENYPDIKAVLELQDYAKAKLPTEIIKVLYNAVKDKCRDWSWGAKDRTFSASKDNKGLFWYDEKWLDRDRGLYFGAYNFDFSSLVERDEDEDGPFLYLYRDVGRLAAPTTSRLAIAIAEIRSNLKLSGVAFGEEEKEGMYLAKQSLGDIITIDGLREAHSMCDRFVERARQFTEALAPSVYRTPNRAKP